MNRVTFDRITAALQSANDSTGIQVVSGGLGVRLGRRNSPYRTHQEISFDFLVPDALRDVQRVPNGNGIPDAVWVSNEKHTMIILPHAASRAWEAEDRFLGEIAQPQPMPQGGGGEKLYCQWRCGTVPTRMIGESLKAALDLVLLPFPTWLMQTTAPLVRVLVAAPVLEGWREDPVTGKLYPVYARVLPTGC